MGKTVPEVLTTTLGLRPRVVLKKEGTFFCNTDRPRLVDSIERNTCKRTNVDLFRSNGIPSSYISTYLNPHEAMLRDHVH